MRAPTVLVGSFLGALHLFPLLSLWGVMPDARISTWVAVASLAPVYLALIYFCRDKHRFTILELAVVAYAAWSVLSFCLYFLPGNPSSPFSYAYGLYYFVLPIACFFAAKTVPADDQRMVLRIIVLLNAFLLGYGMYIHFARPEYFVSFLTNQVLDRKGYTEEWQYFARLQSYLGSTSTGITGVCTIVLLTLGSRLSAWVTSAVLLLCLVATALTLQRASLLGLGLSVCYLIFLSPFSLGKRIGITIVTIVCLMAVFLTYRDRVTAFTPRLLERSTSDVSDGLSRLFVDRGYAPAVRYVSHFPLGVGLGATSSAAASAGLSGWGEVVDANFMRILSDLGVPGLLLFAFVIGAAGWTAIHRVYGFGWLTFLAIHCGIMISTNVLDSYYISHCFWLLLGLLDRSAHSKLFARGTSKRPDHDRTKEPASVPVAVGPRAGLLPS